MGSNQVRFCALEFLGSPLFPGTSRLATSDVLLHSEEEIDILLGGKTFSLLEGTTKIGSIVVLSVANRDDLEWSLVESD